MSEELVDLWGIYAPLKNKRKVNPGFDSARTPKF